MITDLNKILSMNELPPVIMIFGEEEFSADNAYREIIDKAVSNPQDDYELTEIDAQDKGQSLANLIDLCSSISMLGGKTLAAVKNFEKFFPGKLKKHTWEKSNFFKYLNNPNPDSILLIKCFDSSLQGFGRKLRKSSSDPEKVIQRLKFPYNIIIQNYPCIEYSKVYENQMPDWIIKVFSSKNKNIDREAADYLLAQSNPDLRTLYNEIEKIDLYYPKKENINVSDINKLIGSSRSFNVFELQKAIGKRDAEKSILILKNMMAASSSEMLIITMLTRYFKKVWELSEHIGQIHNKFQLAGKVGISPMFIEDYKAALRSYEPAKLNSVFRVLTEADENLKTSKFDKFTIMQNMIIELTKR